MSKGYQTMVRNPSFQRSEVRSRKAEVNLAQCHKGSKWSVSGAPAYAKASAWQASQSVSNAEKP